MKEIQGNLWTWAQDAPNTYIVITTNGTVKRDGCCVMGRGVAKQAAVRFPGLPAFLGEKISTHGNHVHVLPGNLISFPVKFHWAEEANILLINRSVVELVDTADLIHATHIYMPRPGCGNGGLTWDVVRPLLVDKLDDRFTICEVR